MELLLLIISVNNVFVYTVYYHLQQ